VKEQRRKCRQLIASGPRTTPGAHRRTAVQATDALTTTAQELRKRNPPHPGTPHQLSTCTNADRPAGWVLVVHGYAADLVLGMKQCLGQQGTDMAPA